MDEKIYIDGQWVASSGGATLDVINPATEVAFTRIAAATAEDVDRAVVAARRAFDGGWKRTTGHERAAFLRGIAAHIRNRQPELARIEVEDNGKPLPEADWDVGDAAGCFEYYAGLAEDLDARQGEPIAVPDDRFRSSVRYEPVGVAGQIIPWNYPLLMAAWKVAPALAAGCTMVLKPSELTSLTALKLAEISDAAGLPKGVLNVVTGTGAEAGAALTRHPLVSKLAFTGSVPTGRAVMTAAAQDIKAVSLELGGKSPFIVFGDSDLDEAVEWIMFGIFWNQGQVCSATSRIIIDETIYGPLVERLVAASRKIAIGNGLEQGVKLGPLVSAGQLEKVQGFVTEGRRDGARLVSGGERPPGFNRGYFFQPTILDQVPDSSRLWREEVFGPVVCLRSFKTEDEAISIANASQFGLAAAVMSADEARAGRVAAQLEAGIVWINCSQPTFTEAPWGGMKHSGIGRELGRWGLNNYLEVKQVTAYKSDKPWGWYGG
jgi:betaine-aldehyde dehydrogenase